MKYGGMHGRVPLPVCIMRIACTCPCPFQSASSGVRQTHRQRSASQKQFSSHLEPPGGQKHSERVWQQCKATMSGLLLSLAAVTFTPLSSPAIAAEYPGLSSDVPVVSTHARHPLWYMTLARIKHDMIALHCCSGCSYLREHQSPLYSLMPSNAALKALLSLKLPACCCSWTWPSWCQGARSKAWRRG